MYVVAGTPTQPVIVHEMGNFVSWPPLDKGDAIIISSHLIIISSHLISSHLISSHHYLISSRLILV
jgi:hypothetical protein